MSVTQERVIYYTTFYLQDKDKTQFFYLIGLLFLTASFSVIAILF